MSQISLYLINVAISVLIGVGVSLFIRKSLFTLLVDICGTEDRARFWLKITILSYILVAAAIGLAFQPEVTHVQGFTEFSDGAVREERIYYEMADYDPMIYGFGGQLGKTVFGLLLTTGFMAITISRFIRRQARNETLQVQG